MTEHEHRPEQSDDLRDAQDSLRDLDVPDEQTGDITGGDSPTGGSSGEDRMTENVTLNF